MRLSRRLVGFLALLLVAFLVASPFVIRGLLWRWERNPLLRGRQLAGDAGCLTCHDPYRGQEIPNPGSRWSTVPRFEAGNAMMYAESKEEVEEFIRFGALRSWQLDFEAVARLADQRVRMPAYDERLSDHEIDLLTTWASVVEGIEVAGDEAAAAGRQLARQHGCISCHGLEGAGGLPNPGSLAGFIPGFLGDNFTDLVESRSEFEEWIRTGTLDRLAGNPLIRRAWRRQALTMPAYRESLSEQELDALWTWVQAARTAYSP